MNISRRALSLAFIAIVAAGVVACNDAPTNPGASDALQMAERFGAIADSLDGVGMPAYARPYGYVGQLIRLAGGATPITLTVNGKDTTYYAVAEQTETKYWQCRYGSYGADSLPPSDSAPGAPMPPTIEPYPGPPACGLVSSVQNTFYAWARDKEWRLLRVVADTGTARINRWWTDSAAVGVDAPKADPTVRPDGSVGSGEVAIGYSDDVAPIYAPTLWAELMDSRGHFWWATEGSQTSHVVRVGDACQTPINDERVLALWAPLRCNRATFSYEHRLRFDPPPVMLMSPIAGGEDTVRYAMAQQRVLGVITRSDTTGWLPPVHPPRPDSVPVDTGTVEPPGPPPSHPPLDVHAYGIVDSTHTGIARLSMTVTNASADTVRISFPTTQEYDFTVRNPATGESVFTWSATRDFATVVTTRTLAPHASTTYSGEWAYGDRHGQFTLEAYFTSSDHPARAQATLTLP